MSERGVLLALASELEMELTQRILPYWMTHAVDDLRGGFAGLIDADNVADPLAPKGAILNARILWTFAAAERVLGLRAYRETAERALCYFRAFFIDRVHGGVYWMVDADGIRLDERKHVYAQAFAIYALSEHFRASGDDASLHDALRIYRLVERHAYDAKHGGYDEAF
ncbi:MAG: AGE family epimerase/isomerase, partial [Gemmatimonadaceae bacterium]